MGSTMGSGSMMGSGYFAEPVDAYGDTYGQLAMHMGFSAEPVDALAGVCGLSLPFEAAVQGAGVQGTGVQGAGAAQGARATQGAGVQEGRLDAIASTCGVGEACLPYDTNPYYGTVSFDTIVPAWRTIFQCITLDG